MLILYIYRMIGNLTRICFAGLFFLLLSCSENATKNTETKAENDSDNNEIIQDSVKTDSLPAEIIPDTIYLPYPENDLYGYMDTAWNHVTQPVYKIAGEFYEGFACVLAADGFWYMINKKFKPVFKFPHFIPIDFPNDMAGTTDVIPFTEGFLPIQYREGKFGFMRMNNRSAFGKYDEVMNFSNGMAAVRIGEKWGFINQNGDVVIQFKFDVVYSFSDNRAYVCEGEHCYFIDKKEGRYFDHKYLRHAFRFREGLTFISYSDNYDQYFLVDTAGKIVNKGPFDAIYNLGFENGECEVVKNGKCIIIDRAGKKLRDKKDGCQEGC